MSLENCTCKRCIIARAEQPKTAKDSFSPEFTGWDGVLESGTPCDHPGCKQHITHPCERCGRKGAFGHAVIRENPYLKA